MLVRELTPGLILARGVRSERGELLLNADVPLTERYINMLRERGFASVLIHDPDTDDIEIEDIVSERVRVNVTANVLRLYEAMEGALAPLRDQPTHAIEQELQSGDFARAVKDHQTYGDLRQQIEEIVDEVLGAEILTGIHTIRSFDSYQFVHALDSTITAVMIGRRLHFGRDDLKRIASGCLLHDIGMVVIDRSILDKPERLTPEEIGQVGRHPQLGYEMLRQIRPREVLANHVAYQHHERQDGTGYPRGLHGNNRVHRGPADRSAPGRILLDAEICAVADVYDALGADRPYRAAFAPDQVIKTLRRLAGSHLNREVVAHLLAVLPVYPLGTDVVVVSGQYAQFRGIVSRVHREQLDRPTIRLLYAADRRRISPIDLDLRSSDDVIACLPASTAESSSSAR